MQSKYPIDVCSDCGIEANRLTCLKIYGEKPKKPSFDVSTFHTGKCDVCGETKAVTEPRDFFYPDFSLLPKRKTKTRQSEIDKKFGPVCPKCGVRHVSFGVSGGNNLPKGGTGTKCKK